MAVNISSNSYEFKMIRNITSHLRFNTEEALISLYVSLYKIVKHDFSWLTPIGSRYTKKALIEIPLFTITCQMSTGVKIVRCLSRAIRERSFNGLSGE